MTVMQSVDVQKNGVLYAIKTNNLAMFKLLMSDEANKNRTASKPCVSLESQGTGRYSRATYLKENMCVLFIFLVTKYRYGHAVRKIQASRGGREGNNAFAADLDLYDCCPSKFHIHTLQHHSPSPLNIINIINIVII